MSQADSASVVVGGGLSGLVAAVILARKGRRVRLFEGAGRLGGRAQTEARAGFSFNLGPHALYAQGEGRRVLRELGVEVAGHAPADQGLFASLAGKLHLLPGGPGSLFRTSLFTWGEKLATARLLARLPRLEPAAWRSRSVQEWIESEARSQRVRLLLHALVRLTTYVNAPRHLDAGAALEQIQLALAGNVLYLDGGWGRLVEALDKTARREGVEIVTGARVAALEAGERVEAVRLEGDERVPASEAVLAVDPATALRLIDGERAPRLRRSIEGLRPVRAACLDLALSRLPRPGRSFALGLDRALYLSVHSATADLAPAGGALVHVARYLEATERPAREEASGALEAFADEVQPGWRERVVHQRLLPAMTVSHGLWSKEGPRPAPRVDELPGAWLTGDWVGQRGMLADAAIASAETAALGILEQAGVDSGPHRSMRASHQGQVRNAAVS